MPRKKETPNPTEENRAVLARAEIALSRPLDVTRVIFIEQKALSREVVGGPSRVRHIIF